MTHEPLVLKVQSTRAVLKQLDLQHLEDDQLKQLEVSLPKTIV